MCHAGFMHVMLWVLSDTKESLTTFFYFSGPKSIPESQYFFTKGVFCRFINCSYCHDLPNLDSGGHIRKGKFRTQTQFHL
jgi:hypothetical protein